MADTYYADRLKSAVDEWGKGAVPFRTLREQGVVLRRGTHYEITEAFRWSCCYDILWDNSTIPKHLATARHIAIAYNVGRKDLLAAINARWFRAQPAQLRSVG